MSAVIHTVLRMPACLMNASRSAISISRLRGAPSPCAIASALTTPIGRSAAGLPRRLRAHQFALEPGELPRSEDRRRRAVRAVGPAIGAHVDKEDIEQRAVSDLAIDPAGFSQRLPHGHEFVEGAAPARDELEDALVDVAPPVER